MSGGIPFTKMQGVGNDFVVVDGRSIPSEDWPAFAIRVCNRHTGIGADGLLVIDRSDSADVVMRMFNPDGTPDVCGNGMRCVARYEFEKRNSQQAAFAPTTQGPNDATTLTIETLAGIRRAQMADSEG